MKTLHVLVLMALVVFPAETLPQEDKAVTNPQTQAAPQAFVGCYDLKLGRWWPWGFGEDSPYVTPPSRIRLLPLRGEEGFEQNGFLLRAISPRKGAPSGRGRPSYWQAKSNNQIELIWTNGFTGITLELEEKGKELRGWAHPHFDVVPVIPRIARVTAQRISCEASQ
jgi:hypothetical protein